MSLVCPTRERPKPLRRLLDSIVHNTTDYSNFELVFIHDDDDVVTAKTLSDLKKHFAQIEMYIHHRPRHFNLSNAYYNWAWKKGFLHGDYYWTMQDDVVILTKNWNTLIIEAIESYLADKPDRVCCAFAHDTNNRASIPYDPWGWYPIVTKEALDTLHYIYPAHCPTHASEIWLREMYRAIGRYLPILNVELEQVSYRDFGSIVPIDVVGHRMNDRSEQEKRLAANVLDYFSSVSKLKGAIHNARVGGKG